MCTGYSLSVACVLLLLMMLLLYYMYSAVNLKYKLLCPRGTQTCALAVVNIKVNGNGKVILDTYPESDQHQN